MDLIFERLLLRVFRNGLNGFQNAMVNCRIQSCSNNNLIISQRN